MGFLQAPSPFSFQTPPADYGYLVVFLVTFVGILLGALFFGFKYSMAYRDKQDAKRDAEFERRESERKQEWREHEATRVEARKQLLSEVGREFSEIRAEFKEFSTVHNHELNALRAEIKTHSERLLRLEMNYAAGNLPLPPR